MVKSHTRWSYPAQARALAAASLLLLWAPLAVAQEEGVAPEEFQVSRDGEVIDSDDPLYWSTVRGIETIQQRPILKEGRFAMTGYLGVVPNNIFEQYFPVGARLNYFVLENIGVELSGSYTFGKTTDLESYLLDQEGVGASGVLLGDRQQARFNFGITWSPIFGKAAWHNQAIKYFDMYLFAGFGAVVKSTQPNFGAELSTGVSPEGALGGGLMFFMTEHTALRLDFRQFIFQKVSGGVANPSEVSLGFTYML